MELENPPIGDRLPFTFAALAALDSGFHGTVDRHRAATSHLFRTAFLCHRLFPFQEWGGLLLSSLPVELL
jgi:hypothetical protein